jgi:glycosyltransferase involved in cell wall biosynthesis
MRVLYSKPLSAPAVSLPPGFELAAEEAALSGDFERRWRLGSDYLAKLYLAFTLWRKRRNYDAVVTGRYGEYFAVLQSLCVFGRKPHLLLDIEWAAGSSRRWKTGFSRWLRRRVIAGASKIQVFCRSEADNYARCFGVDKGKFAWLPYCAGARNGEAGPSSEYLFFGGINSRDYGVLFSAVDGLPVEVRIAVPPNRIEGRVLPGNVRLLGFVTPEEYWRQVAGCRIVVLSLEPNQLRCPGVVTYVRAMQMGKCVIVNEPVGAVDYITHGETGFLVPPSDAGALRAQIQAVLDHPELAARVGANASRAAALRYTPEVYLQGVRAMLEAVTGGQV